MEHEKKKYPSARKHGRNKISIGPRNFFLTQPTKYTNTIGTRAPAPSSVGGLASQPYSQLLALDRKAVHSRDGSLATRRGGRNGGEKSNKAEVDIDITGRTAGATPERSPPTCAEAGSAYRTNPNRYPLPGSPNTLISLVMP